MPHGFTPASVDVPGMAVELFKCGLAMHHAMPCCTGLNTDTSTVRARTTLTSTMLVCDSYQHACVKY